MRKAVIMAWLMVCFSPCYPKAEITWITPLKVDLGEIKEGDVVSGQIRFVNSGRETVIVTHVQPSCGCTVTELDRTQFAPGDTATISYALNTAHFSGTVRKNILVSFANKDLPNTVVVLQARIFTDLEISPNYLYFQNIAVDPDTVVTQYVKIKSRHDRPIKIQAEYESDLFRVVPAKFTVKPDETYLVRVELIPRREGRENASVTFKTDFPEKPTLSLFMTAVIKTPL